MITKRPPLDPTSVQHLQLQITCIVMLATNVKYCTLYNNISLCLYNYYLLGLILNLPPHFLACIFTIFWDQKVTSKKYSLKPQASLSNFSLWFLRDTLWCFLEVIMKQTVSIWFSWARVKEYRWQASQSKAIRSLKKSVKLNDVNIMELLHASKML